MSKDMTSVHDTKRAVLMVALMFASCKSAPSPYDKLCRIYEGLASQADEDIDWMALSQRVADEAPELSEDHSIVMLNQKSSRYGLFRKRASQRWKQDDWQCDAIKKRWPPE